MFSRKLVDSVVGRWMEGQDGWVDGQIDRVFARGLGLLLLVLSSLRVYGGRLKMGFPCAVEPESLVIG